MKKMLLAMRVVYEGEEIKYDMSVGNGRMTIKWLGLAAAQHFSAKVKPGGYRRHREHTGPIRIISTSAKLLPCRVYTAQSTFLHPEKSISEELTSGEEVFVELLSKISVSQIGRPLRDRWMFIAFCTADQNVAERKKAIDCEYRAMEEAHAQQVRDAEAKAKDVAAKKGAKMRRVMSSQLYCSDKVGKAFESDWAKLCHPVTMPMDKITEDLEEQSSVKGVVLAHYVTLVEVFKHYASVGSAVATGDLDIMEFSAFIHDLRGFGAAKSRDLVEKSFGEAISACSGDRGRSSTPAMGVVGFIFAVIWLACGRHHVSSGISAGDSASGGSKIKTASSVHEAVALFMEDVILPLAHRKVIGLQIKTALGSDDILALYHDNDARLQLVFDKYSKADDRAGGGTAALCVLLNIAEFRMLLRDAGLLGGNNNKGEDDELTVKEARQAFAGAQNDLCGGDASAAAPPLPLEVGAPVEQMTYPEFLEGIARVAMLKWEDATSTPKDKIERAIAATASLLHASPSSTTS